LQAAVVGQLHDTSRPVLCGMVFQLICARCTVLMLFASATQWTGVQGMWYKVVQHYKLCPVVLAAVLAAVVMQNIQSEISMMGCDCLLSFVSVHQQVLSC